MQIVRSRQLLTDLSFNAFHQEYTSSKGWDFPTVLIDGVSVAASLTQISANAVASSAAHTGEILANASSIATEKGRLDTLLDADTSLDQITELRTAWEAGDGTLNSAISGLTSAAATDRAAIRTEFATADTTLQAQGALNAADIDTLEGKVNVTHATLHTQHINQIATKAPAASPTFTGDVTINSNKIIGDSGTEIRFNQTNMQLNTHGSGSLSGTAFNNIQAGLYPHANQTYDIGSGGKRWREVYSKDIDFNGTFFKNGAAFAKGDISLGNVDNTTDASKPISTAGAAKNTSQDSAIALNTVKVGFTNTLVANAPAVVANTAKTSYSDAAQVSTNTSDIAQNVSDIAVNTLKTGFTNTLVANAPAVVANTAKISYPDAAQVSTNTSDIAQNVSDIAVNTLKTGFTNALVANAPAVVANTAKNSYTDSAQVSTNTSDIATNVSAIALNTAKVSYPDASQVSTNTSGIATNVTAIALNTAKVSYTDASTVASHATLHTAHTASLATKAGLSGHQTYTGRQQFGDGASGIDGRLTIHSNDGGANSLLILDSRKQADSCLIYFRHAGGNKFTIGLNTDSDLEIYNRATGNVEIRLATGGGIFLPSLPTDDPLVVGQLYTNNNNKVVISEGPP